MITFFSLIIFFGVLFFFGWQLSRFIFNEKRIEALIPLAAIIGISLYLSILNLFSYFINIKVNFYLILIIFAFLSYWFFRINKKREKTEWGIAKSWRTILFGTALLIMILVGIIGIRYIDDKSLNHLPVSTTIAEGNFFVRDPFAPSFPFQDHYAYNLFSAAIYKITNLPVWFGLDFQNFIFIGILFLMGFLLVKDFCKDNFKAYVASLVMILGGNLNFLYGTEGLSFLYRKYIFNLPTEASFKFLNDMFFGKDIWRGLIAHYSQAEWITIGFALTITVIYLYFRAINDKDNWFKISFLAAIVFSFLALSAEVFFGVLCIVFLIYPLIFAILKKDWESGKFCLKISFLILFLGLAIASFQGGIVTQTVKQTFFGYTFPIAHHFSINPEYLFKGLIVVNEHVFVPIFSSAVFLGWGWMLIFIIPAALYLLRNYFQIGLFLILLICISFFLPLIVSAGAEQGNFARINYLTDLFWNLIFGLFLGWLLLFFSKKWQRLLITTLILGVTFQGLFYFALFPIFPNLEKNQPLLGELRPNSAELEAINWIKKHTTIKDYFLNFEAWNNTKFVMLTGRFAPDFYFCYGGGGTRSCQGRPLTSEMVGYQNKYQNILQECGPKSLRDLNYYYLYVNEGWPGGMEEKCLANNNLELKFEAEEGNKFVRIYKILNQ